MQSGEDPYKTILGMPKEPYGFSKNIFGRVGPPGFQDVYFEVLSGQEITLEINLKQPFEPQTAWRRRRHTPARLILEIVPISD